MNAVYARMFGDHRPARTTVEVSGLPGEGLRVEIDCVASAEAGRDDGDGEAEGTEVTGSPRRNGAERRRTEKIRCSPRPEVAERRPLDTKSTTHLPSGPGRVAGPRPASRVERTRTRARHGSSSCSSPDVLSTRPARSAARPSSTRNEHASARLRSLRSSVVSPLPPSPSSPHTPSLTSLASSSQSPHTPTLYNRLMPETALITGASGGIGEDLARLIAAGGRDLVLLARSATEAPDTCRRALEVRTKSRRRCWPWISRRRAQPTRSRARSPSGASPSTCSSTTPGSAPSASSHARIPPNSLRMLQVNVVALTMLTRLLLPGMIERRRGRIMNVASTAAFQPGPLMAVYYATKAYVLVAVAGVERGNGGHGRDGHVPLPWARPAPDSRSVPRWASPACLA